MLDILTKTTSNSNSFENISMIYVNGLRVRQYIVIDTAQEC